MFANRIPGWGVGRTIGSDGLASPGMRRANRRRLWVFLGTLVVALVSSLGYTFLRPAIYRASARLEITPAAAAPDALTGPTQTRISIAEAEPVRPFLTEVQVLTSRPVLEEVVKRLQAQGHALGDFGSDPVGGLQAHVQAIPVESTNVVDLFAEGRKADLLAPIVNTIVAVYRDRLLDAYRATTATALAQADSEVSKLQADVAAKRQDVEAYRLRYDIVSLERGENAVLARVRNQSDALGKANERLAAAEGNVQALAASAATGKIVVRSRDNPTLANIEQRLSQAREDMHDLERSYTQEYLATQPQAMALRARIAGLERQLADQRHQSQQDALTEAQEELASAQSAANRLKSQMASDRQEVAQFTTHFNEYQEMQASLADLERAYRDAVQRRARLEASERARMPQLRVVEAAATPVSAWRPLYWRDAGISVAGSLILALLAMWLVELFNRTDPAPAVIVAQALAPGLVTPASPEMLPSSASPTGILSGTSPSLLPQSVTLPRELRDDEVDRLLAAADSTSRPTMLLLLSGIDTEEVLALRAGDVDLERRVIHVPGASAREIALSEPVRRFFATQETNVARVLPGDREPPMTGAAVDGQILSAAHDARLERAEDIDAKSLRHTYIAYLVRQGIRFADLQRIVGALPAPVLAVYAKLSPESPPAALEAIDLVLPPIGRLG